MSFSRLRNVVIRGYRICVGLRCRAVLASLLGVTTLLCCCGLACASEADKLATSAHLILPAHAHSQNFSFAFPIPDDEWQAGVGWVRRQIRVSDSLSIIDENLTRQWYRITVHLAGKADQQARGSLYLFLKKGSADAAIPARPPQPIRLRLEGQPLQPDFLFDGKGETSAFTLFHYPGGEELWSRIFSESGWGRLDEGSLEINGRYLLKAQQSNGAAQYSPPAYVWFRVIGKKSKCTLCNGSGMFPPPQKSDESPKPCSLCHGSGTLLSPCLKMEPPGRDGQIMPGELLRDDHH